MKGNRAKMIEWIIGSFAFVAGCIYGSFIEFHYQKNIYDILRNTSAIIFGVVGAWYAVITPMYLGNKNKNGREAQFARELLRSLLVPIKYSIYILCITIIFQIIYPVSSIIIITPEFKIFLKGLSFGVVCTLSVMMLFTLIRSLIPNNFIQTDIEIKKELSDYEARIRRQTNME